KFLLLYPLSFASLIIVLVLVVVLGKLSSPAYSVFWMVGITAKRTAIHTSGGRRDVARSASPQDRRPTKQAETKRRHKPVQLMPPRFEHEHEDDLVADLGVRLRRAQSSRSR